MIENKHIAQNIKTICKEKGVPISSMLENCNINKNFIYDIENKDKNPSCEKISTIADYLDCSVDYLLGRSKLSKIFDLPEALATEIEELYKNSEEFISETDFIFFPSFASKYYSFNAKDYDIYTKIYDIAYEYATGNNINFEAFTGVNSKDEYMHKLVKRHDDMSARFWGIYYTFKNAAAFNKFHEVYKLYVKAYTQKIFKSTN